MKLRKLTKNWWIDFHKDGKRYRQNTHTSDRKEALAFMRSIDTARRAPTFEQAVEILKMLYGKPIEGLTPLDSLWPTYERLARSVGKASIARRSWERRRQVVEKFLKWLTADRPTIATVEHITGPIAAGYAAHLADTGLKTKTRKNILGDLGTVWKLMEKASPGIRNPWANLAPKVTDMERGKAFTPDQERAVLEAAKRIGKDWYPVCVVMRHTGLRYSDVSRLKWANVRDGVIYTIPHKTARHGIEVAIPLTAAARAAVDGLVHLGDYLFPLHAELYDDHSKKAQAVLNFREVLDAAGVKGSGYTIHSWRHTAATRLAEAGVGAETRKRILGHTTDAMAEHYDHAAHLAETRAALDAAAQ